MILQTDRAVGAPLISFITATYNAAATLPDTIASIERETAGIEYEHIFMDGGSTDGTVELIRRLKGEKALLVSEPDEGVYDAMNKGVAKARGEWIAIINADDYYAPGAVKMMLSAAEAQPGAAVIHGDMQVLFSDRAPVVKPGLGPRGRLGLVHPICHPSMWARRDLYDRLGLYDTRYRIAADQQLFYRILDAKERCCYLPQVVTIMRAGGLSGKHYDVGTLELLDIHASRKGLTGLAAHLLFYRQARLRSHSSVPKGGAYWSWAARDFLRRRLGRTSLRS